MKYQDQTVRMCRLIRASIARVQHRGRFPWLSLTERIHSRTDQVLILTLKAPSKIFSRRHFILFYLFFFFSEKIKCLDIPCESSAWQTIHMKCQDLFSLKKKIKKISFQTVVCCSCDWRSKSLRMYVILEDFDRLVRQRHIHFIWTAGASSLTNPAPSPPRPRLGMS